MRDRLDSSAPLPGPWAALATALAYGTVGWLAVQLATPPSPASAMYPSAGIALVAALVYGRWALAGVVLGSFTVNLVLAIERGPVLPGDWATVVLLGLGAALQAAIGRVLIRRWVSQPLTLTEPVDMLRFFLLGGPLACTVSASVATAVLLWGGVLTTADAASNWWTWWIGDTLGVLIGAPIALTLVGQPRAAWGPRRSVVALPMLLASGLLATATAWVAQAHDERMRVTFEHDAQTLADSLDARLQQPQMALLALHGVYDTQPSLEPAELRKVAQAWLQAQPFLKALGYSERVARPDVPAFEARVRAEGPVADYAVFDRPEGGPSPGPEVVAIRQIEPLAPNRGALGVNALSIPAARAAVEQALVTGRDAATAGFRLTQSPGDETGIALYRLLYRGETQDEPSRRQAFRGLVFVTLRLDALVTDILTARPAYLDWCLIDPVPGAERMRLAGPPGCEAAAVTGPLSMRRSLSIGGRDMVLRVSSQRARVPGVAEGGGWLFSVIGLLATSLLGALLLVVSGREQRIQTAVAARTRDLRRAGQALRESRERLRNIVDHVPIGVVYTDLEGRVMQANPRLLAMMGLQALPDDPTLLTDWAHPDDRAALGEELRRLSTGQTEVVRRQMQLVTEGGEARQVQLGLSTLHDEQDQPRRLVGVVEDIGEHLLLQATERARQQAEAASLAKSEFLGRMSHELRTPLNAVLGFAQLLSRDSAHPLEPHHQRWADQIQDAGWHLLNMINDTLDLSMIESGSVKLHPQVLSPEALLQATLPLLALPAETHQVQLHPLRVQAPKLRLTGDETRVKQILTNLLSNAVKYNVPGGEVEATVRQGTDGAVEIVVRDTGLGLTPSQQEGLFQPFNRLGRESSGTEGTGIGLVISRRLAELMGGRLFVQSSTPGKGSTFVLSLPRAEDALAHAAGADDDTMLTSYRRRHVLYVEDNETNAVLLRGMLAQRPQIELSVSTLGLDALVAIRSEPPDLLLLDMHLPDIDGMDLLRHLKQDDSTAALPVLVLSADATPERRARALAEGAAGYLTKPLDLAELLTQVDRLLSEVDTRWG
jgi:PAS domain S-box-containing protein